MTTTPPAPNNNQNDLLKIFDKVSNVFEKGSNTAMMVLGIIAAPILLIVLVQLLASGESGLMFLALVIVGVAFLSIFSFAKGAIMDLGTKGAVAAAEKLAAAKEAKRAQAASLETPPTGGGEPESPPPPGDEPKAAA